MKSFKIKSFLVSFEGPKTTKANKTGIDFMIFILILVENFCNTMLYIIFQYCWEPVLIQRKLIGFKAILKYIIWRLFQSCKPFQCSKVVFKDFQGWKGYWTVDYIGLQSFINTISHSFDWYNFGGLLWNLDWVMKTSN